MRARVAEATVSDGDVEFAIGCVTKVTAVSRAGFDYVPKVFE
jgi:hypothetical protein